MKKLLLGIAFVLALAFTPKAHASPVSSCDNLVQGQIVVYIDGSLLYRIRCTSQPSHWYFVDDVTFWFEEDFWSFYHEPGNFNSN